jgi:hypothetical protein
MTNSIEKRIKSGVGVGKLAGRLTKLGFVVYLVSLIYRSGQESIAVLLTGIIGCYVLVSIGRDYQYGYSPLSPINWTEVSPEGLDPEDRHRATLWTGALRVVQLIGGVGLIIAIFVSGLDLLGYVLLASVIPVLIGISYRYYSRDTKPWYPKVPSEIVSD